jgi:hypothetical protein
MNKNKLVVLLICQLLYTRLPSKFICLQVGHKLVNDVLHRPVECNVVQRMGLVDGHFALQYNIQVSAGA